MQFVSESSTATQEFAQKLSQQYKDGAVIALIGQLGAGKTTFTQGFAEGLGIKGRLISPTFVLVRQYDIPGNTQGKLFHIDLYRLDEIEQIHQIGITEVLSNPHNLVLIEWAEKLGELMPKGALTVSIKIVSEEKREITITDPGD